MNGVRVNVVLIEMITYHCHGVGSNHIALHNHHIHVHVYQYNALHTCTVTTPPQISEDADSIREVIVTLRRNLSPQDPQQLVIDALEQTIAELLSKIMDRTNSPTGKLVGSPTGKRSKRHSHVSYMVTVYVGILYITKIL